MWLQDTLWGLLDGVAEPHCAGCGRGCRAALCEACVEHVAALPRPLTLRLAHGRLLAGFAFEGLVRRVLHEGKYRGRRAAIHLLAMLTAERLAPDLRAGGAPVAVVPVPLGRRRRRARGYNQAEIVARALAGLGDAPVAGGLRRLHETRAQVGRDAASRRDNLAGAFAWQAMPLEPRGCVWLVDDVVTTGATLAAAATALQRAGASRIERVAVARTL